MGDFNLNILNYIMLHSSTGKFADEMYLNIFFPVMTHSTRITSHLATLIDTWPEMTDIINILVRCKFASYYVEFGFMCEC